MAKKREASVEVKSDWNLVEQFDFNSLNRIVEDEPKAEDM